MRLMPRTQADRVGPEPNHHRWKMNQSKTIAATLSLALIGLVPAAQAAQVETGWVKFQIRTDRGNTYVYPMQSDGSLSYVFAGNCQFNGLVVSGSDDLLHGSLLTAKEQALRISLVYDDSDGPVCRLAYMYIEWAD